MLSQRSPQRSSLSSYASPRVTRIVLAGLIFSFSFAFPSVASEPEPEIKQWQRDGIAAVFSDPDINVWKAAILNETTVQVLISMGEAAASEAPKLGALLQDGNSGVREAAAWALGGMGEAAASEAPKLVALLQDGDSGVREAAAAALGEMGPATISTLLAILNLSYTDSADAARFRSSAHYLGAGLPENETLIRWLGNPIKDPKEGLTYTDGKHALNVFKEAWPLANSMPDLQADLAKQIAVVATTMRGEWKESDLELLKIHEANLKETDSTHAAAVSEIVVSVERKKTVSLVVKIWIGHVVFWVLLIVIYPRSTQVQAIFFWNPWVRQLIGLGYIGFALTWVPYLRRKLFAPFKESLVADAALDYFDPKSYFPESGVMDKVSGRVEPLAVAFPRIQGQVVLEGESGLGKSMFLRHCSGV